MIREEIKKLFKKFIPVLLGGLLVTSSFLLGVLFGNGTIEIIGPFKINLKPIIINKEVGKPSKIDFSLFWEAWNYLENNYVGEIDYQKMLYGAIKGIAESTGDPYTVYMTSEETKEFLEEVDSSFSGIGIEIGIRNDELVVIAPLSGTPAEKAGLRTKDKILKINNEETEGMSVDEAVKKIRGPKGTEVTLLIQRGNEEPKEIKIIRDIIKVESVKLEYKNKGNKKIAILRISKFDQDTPHIFSGVVDDILIKQPEGVILDLRGNPGGYFTSALDIASEFFDNGLITIEESKNDSKKEFNVTKKGRLTQIPLVVLIDSGSASASEIVAGAIKDRQRGKLVGEKSFGKGSVQIVFNLKEGSLKITTSKWLTPKGKSINNEGIEPDIKEELTKDDWNNDRDPQMEKALEII